MTVPVRVLVVDDDHDFVESQVRILEGHHYAARGVFSGAEARQFLARDASEVDVALIDMYMPEGPEAGLSLVKLIAEQYPGIVSVVITGFGDLANAVRCMQAGAFDYVAKGETPTDVILEVVAKAAQYQRRLRDIETGFRSGVEVLEKLTRELPNAREVFYRVEDELRQPISTNVLSLPGRSRDPARTVFATMAAEAARLAKGPDLFWRRAQNKADQKDQIWILRRWNSHTPCLLDVWGGGYFLRWRGHGTIIDPGASFLRLFGLHTPYNIEDIDMVLATHDHMDHCLDLGALISLLRAYNKWRRDRSMPAHIWDVAVSPGTAAQFRSILDHPENQPFLRSTSTPGCGALAGTYPYHLHALRAFHSELLGQDTSVGFRFDLIGADRSIVVSGDTAIAAGATSCDGSALVKGYQGASLLILHVGTMEKPDEDRLAQHLGMTGVVEVLRQLQDTPPELVVLTEWGYEFGRLGFFGRTGFCRHVVAALRAVGCDQYYAAVDGERVGKGRVPILPADIGLRVSLPELHVWLPALDDFLPSSQVRARERVDRIEYVRWVEPSP